MPLRKCNGIQNTVTGFWLVGFDENNQPVWGFPSKAQCFTEDEQQRLIAELNALLAGRGSVVGGRPNDRP